MDVLLLQDIAGVGRKNDLIAVGDGYALNCLLPGKKALVATPQVRRSFAEHIRLRAEEREREKERKAGVLAALRGKEVRFVRKATKAGKLYGAIVENDIVGLLDEQYGIRIDAASVVMPVHIKTTGSFTVDLRIETAVLALPVFVTAETTKKS